MVKLRPLWDPQEAVVPAGLILPEFGVGHLSARDWFFLKRTHVAWGAYDGDRLVGHAAIRYGSELPPGNGEPPAGARDELCRLMVHPGYRGRGIGGALVDVLGRPGLFAVCEQGGVAEHLFARGLWLRHRSLVLDLSPGPGVLYSRV